MEKEPLKADSITFKVPDYLSVPARVCSICMYKFEVGDIIIQRVTQNEDSSWLDMFRTENVHIRCTFGISPRE